MVASPVTGVWIAIWVAALIYSDFVYRRLPNALVLGAAGCGLVYYLAFGHALLGADGGHIAAGVGLALLLTLPGYVLRGLGAGDVKLLVAIGLLGGVSSVLVAFVAGAVLVAALLATRVIWQPLLFRFPRVSGWLGDRSPGVAVDGNGGAVVAENDLPGAGKKGSHKNIPFGAALAAGLLIQVFAGVDI